MIHVTRTTFNIFEQAIEDVSNASLWKPYRRL